MLLFHYSSQFHTKNTPKIGGIFGLSYLGTGYHILSLSLLSNEYDIFLKFYWNDILTIFQSFRIKIPMKCLNIIIIKINIFSYQYFNN